MERWKAVGLRCHLCQLSFQFPLGNNRMVILTSSSSGEDSQDLEKHSTTPRSAMAVLLLALICAFPLQDAVLYYGPRPRGLLLLPQSCSARRRHRHGHEATAAPVVSDSRDVGVEEGPAALQGKFTVSDFPSKR